MRRPNGWPAILLPALLLFAGYYAILTWVAPRVVMQAIEQALGGQLSVGRVSLSVPLTIAFSDLRLPPGERTAGFAVERMVLQPGGISPASRTLRIDTLELERPFLRVIRSASGAWQFPNFSPTAVRQGIAGLSIGGAHVPIWRLEISSLKITDGTLEFIDEQPTPVFHGLLDHVSVVLGPLTMPFEAVPTSVAARTQLVGASGESAPLYCSGWIDWPMRDLQVSCRLEPLRLATFEPYFHGRSELRVYTATIAFTSQWLARANDFTGNLQLEVADFSEGDFSIQGRTIMDIKRVIAGGEPRISGEIALIGSLDRPQEWHAQFLPGDDHMQRLVKRLLDRSVEVIRLSFFGRTIPLSLTPTSPAGVQEIQAASKEVREALELLAFPTMETPSILEPVPIQPEPAPEIPPLSGG